MIVVASPISYVALPLANAERSFGHLHLPPLRTEPQDRFSPRPYRGFEINPLYLQVGAIITIVGGMAATAAIFIQAGRSGQLQGGLIAGFLTATAGFVVGSVINWGAHAASVAKSLHIIEAVHTSAVLVRQELQKVSGQTRTPLLDRLAGFVDEMETHQEMMREAHDCFCQDRLLGAWAPLFKERRDKAWSWIFDDRSALSRLRRS